MRRIPTLGGLPIRMRLALWNVGVLALTLAMFGVVLQYTNQSRLTARVDEELHRRAAFLAGARFGRDGWGLPHHHGPPPFTEWAAGERGPDGWNQGGPGPGHHRFGEWQPDDRPPPPPGPSSRIRYFDPWGRPLSRGPGARALDPDALTDALRTRKLIYTTTTAFGQPARVLSVPLLREGQVAGGAQLVVPLTNMYEELGRLTRAQLTLIPLALLAAALGGLFLTERALRPIRQITQAAARIGAGSDNFGFWISDFGLDRQGRGLGQPEIFPGNPKSKRPEGTRNPKSPHPGLSERLPVEGNDELSELAATFNGMLGRLEQAFMRLALALEQQRRFTADASHELRTPLTIIKAHTSLALEEERTNQEYRQALVAADRAADATTRIVQDLLLLARADAGQLRTEAPPGSTRRPTPIREVLEDAAEAFRGPDLAPIRIDLPDPSLAVPGDRSHLVRLFSNLFENAVRHTGPDGRIDVSVVERPEGLAVRVADTGEGIPPEHLPHVCERFYRVDAARNRRQGGTGLGLAICVSIVEAHGGSLVIESAVGEGTTVTVRLPGPVSSAAKDSPPEESRGPASLL